MSNLSQEEVDQLVLLLNKMGSPMPVEVYTAIAKHTVQPAIETVVFRYMGGGLHILLTQRSTNDPVWPGMWHTPGTICRPSDALPIGQVSTFERQFERMQRAELGIRFQRTPYYVGHVFHATERGVELSMVHVCEANGEPKEGEFFDVNALPANLIAHQRPVIQMAVMGYGDYVLNA